MSGSSEQLIDDTLRIWLGVHADIRNSSPRKTMRFVPVKTVDQQAAAMVLKTRELLVRQQTQVINALRAHMHEFGIITGTGVTKVSELFSVIRDNDDARVRAFRYERAR